MSDNRKVAERVLLDAKQTIMVSRPGVHGSTENSFQMIADFWNVHLRHAKAVRGHDTIFPQDVAQMMSLLKKARALYGDATNPDNFVDDTGYTALAGMLQLPDEKTDTDKVTGGTDAFTRELQKSLIVDAKQPAVHTGIKA